MSYLGASHTYSSTKHGCNVSLVIQHFEQDDVIKICNRKIFDFYAGLSHILVSLYMCLVQL